MTSSVTREGRAKYRWYQIRQVGRFAENNQDLGVPQMALHCGLASLEPILEILDLYRYRPKLQHAIDGIKV